MAKMKLKTLSGAKKRFKMTASGKIKRNASKRRHILTKKTTKLTRGLRMNHYVDKSNEATVRKMMPTAAEPDGRKPATEFELQRR